MICEVISTGTEIMNGTVVDTNSNYIMKRLYDLGIETSRGVSISDDRDIMFRNIEESIEKSDVIYIIGGLGPTEDDHTKDIVSDILDLRLVLDEDILRGLEERYARRNMDMPVNNRQQALILEGSTVLVNNYGTAPGLFIEKNNKKIFLLPGPPRELIPMFEDSIQYLNLNDFSNLIETINTIGMGESNLEIILKTIDKPKGVEVLTYAKDRRVDIQILYNNKIDRFLIDEYISGLEDELEGYIYGNNYSSLEEMFLKKCLDKDIRVGFAESCTGGLLASRLTDIPGASNILERAIVSYTKSSKMDELAVKKDTLDMYGAVSQETAIEMAQGIRDKSKVDLGISITGVAGPGKEEGKDEGLVYIGVSTANNTFAKEHHFNGDRKTIKSLAASQGFIEGIKIIEKM